MTLVLGHISPISQPPLQVIIYTLNYFISVQQILIGLVVSVVYWTIWVLGLNPTVFRIIFFSFKLKRLALS